MGNFLFFMDSIFNIKCICCDSNDISEATKTSFFKLPVNKCNSCNYHFLKFNKNKFDIKKYYHDTYWSVFRNLNNNKNLSGRVDPAYIIKKLPKHLGNIIELTGVRKSLVFSQFNYLKSHIKGKKLLEIGSGEGFLLEWFEKNGFDVFGIEPSKENLPVIQKKIKKGKCITGYIEDSHILKNKFNVIVISHVLEHLVDCKEQLIKLNKLLESNGIIFIEVPNCKNLEMLEHSINTQPHIHHFSKNNLKMLVEKCGYSVVESSVFIANVVTIPQHIKYLLKWIFKKDHYKPASEIEGNNLRLILRKK